MRSVDYSFVIYVCSHGLGNKPVVTVKGGDKQRLLVQFLLNLVTDEEKTSTVDPSTKWLWL